MAEHIRIEHLPAISEISGLQTELDARLNQSRIVTVGASGCDFTAIQAAINSITDAATGKRYVVLVYAGTYAEDVTMKQYVSLIGVCADQVIITCAGTDDHRLLLASDATLANLSIQTPDQVAKYAIQGITVSNSIVRECNFDGIILALGGSPSTNCRIIGNRIRHPNPIWFQGATACEVAYNECVYDGVGSDACLGFADLQYAMACHIHHNYAYLKATNVVTDTAYAMSLIWKDNRIEHNHITVITARQKVVGLLLIGGSNMNLGTNYASNNSFTLHSTHAAPIGAAIAARRTDYTKYVSDLRAVGNTVFMSGVNPGTWYQFTHLEDEWIEDEWSLPPLDSGIIYADSDSLGLASGATLRRCADYQLVLLRSGRKTPRVQYHRDLSATSATSLIPATTPINMADGTPVIISALVMPDAPRNLRLVGIGGAATGTVTFHGYDAQDRYQTEAITLDGGQDKVGAKAFKSFWYYQVTTPGANTATLGHGDIVALECDISAAGDVRGMAKGAGAVRPPVTAPGAVSATNMTVNCAVITALDDVELLYEGLED